MFVNDSTTEGEDEVILSNFFYQLQLKLVKSCFLNVMKNRERALQIGAKIGSAAVSKNPKAALYTIPDLIVFCDTGE